MSFGSYTINDKRGKEQPSSSLGVCRVCGSKKHFHDYGQSYKECLDLLREKYQRALSSLRSFDPELADHIDSHDR